MKVQISTIFAILSLLCPLYASGSDFEDKPTPIEQEDTKTINQINDGTSFEDQPTPIEQEDMKTISPIN